MSIRDVLGGWHLAHPLLAMVPILIAGALGHVEIGSAVAVGFYWGREVTHSSLPTGSGPWWRGFDLRRWSWDNHLDFWPVLVLAVGIAYWW